MMLRVTGFFGVCAGLLGAFAVTAETTFEPGEGVRGENSDGGASWELGGRVHFDSAQFDADVTPLEDDSDLRRARVIFRAQPGDDWRFAADYDFGGVVEGWKSLYAQYRGWGDVRVTFGNQIAPFSMDELTGSNDTSFMERALPNALSPGLLTGVSLQTTGRYWSLTGGIFANEIDDQQRRKADGQGVALRVTTAPIRSDTAVLHFGLAAEFREVDDSTVRFRARPESYLTSQRLVDTGSITGVRDFSTIGIELAGKRGPFSLQAEYLRADVPRATLADLEFDGDYVAIGWVLTGESHSYSRRNGTFGGVEPQRAAGAFELVARMSRLDLNSAEILGGVERNRTYGVSWYFRRDMRLMLDYIDIEATPNANGIDESPSIVEFRFQANL